MELYIGESIAEIDVNGNCVEISDELLDFLSINSKNIPVDISSIMSINPYGDEIITKEKIEGLPKSIKELIDEGIIGFGD